MTHEPTTSSDAGERAFDVRRVTPALRLTAAERLVEASGRSGARAAREFLTAAKRHGIALDNMWCSIEREAQSDGEAVARTSCLIVPGEGRTTMLFTSAPDPSLVGELSRVIESASAASPTGTLSQTLLAPGEQVAHEAFRGAGFIDVGTLDYLQRKRPTSKEAQGWALQAGDLGGGVSMVPAPVGDDSLLRTALERSYEGTLDCPELCGMRETDDVIASHRATGEHDPTLWWLIERAGEPLGAVLANPSPTTSAVELVYMGVAPDLRGHGVGGRALRHLLATCAARSERLVTCAVDRRNTPARAMYEKYGFTGVQTRIALVKQVL